MGWECGGAQVPRLTLPCSPHSHCGAPAGWGCGSAGRAQHGAGPAGLETQLPAGLGGPRVSWEIGQPLSHSWRCTPTCLLTLCCGFCDLLCAPVPAGNGGGGLPGLEAAGSAVRTRSCVKGGSWTRTWHTGIPVWFLCLDACVLHFCMGARRPSAYMCTRPRGTFACTHVHVGPRVGAVYGLVHTREYTVGQYTGEHGFVGTARGVHTCSRSPSMGHTLR